MENWKIFSEFDKTHYVDTEHAVEGTGSLRVESIDENTEATIYEPSLNSEEHTAASEGRIKTTVRRTEDVYLGLYLRFVDLENHYFIVGAGGGSVGRDSLLDKMGLLRTENGETELISAVEFETFSDRTKVDKPDPSWIPFRITWFSDELDGFRIWVQEDANEDGEWDDVGGTLVDPDPAFGPGSTPTGSGVGFGGNKSIGLSSNEGLWFDQTEIYYDTDE